MKDFDFFEVWIQDQRALKAQAHTWYLWGVCEQWDFTLSTLAYWRNCAYFLFQQVVAIRRWKIRFSFILPIHWKFDTAWYLGKTRYFLCRINSFPQFFANSARGHWQLAQRGVNYLKLLKLSFFSLALSKEGPWIGNYAPMFKTTGNSELLSLSEGDFASCEETRKSRSGACIFFCNSLIHWNSEHKITSQGLPQ